MTTENERIKRVDIEQTMKTAYIDYAMSVMWRGLCPMCATASSLCTAASCIR